MVSISFLHCSFVIKFFIHTFTYINLDQTYISIGVEWDAVELPSQFMENWCYDKPTVYGFAKHYETGEPLPEEMFEKLSQQRTFGAGMMACRQLLFGMMDIELHSNYDPNGSETIFDVHRRMAEIYTPYSMPVPEDRFLCGFGHIFAGGYSAGYYSYKWAEVMSADAFGAFEDVGLDNEQGVREVGMKFRDTVVSSLEMLTLRIFSVTKLITLVDMLYLVEFGRWRCSNGCIQALSWP